MLRIKLLPFGFSLALAIADFNPVVAFPIAPQMLNTAATTSDVQLDFVRFGGRGGGGMHRGMGGVHRGMGVGRGGYGYRRGAAVARRGYGVNRAVGHAAVGRYRVGGRYYGGVWYGTGRRFWGGRWWPYGVGSCWRASPIGYVWVCG